MARSDWLPAITNELHMSIDHGGLFWLRFKRGFFSAGFFIISQKNKRKGDILKPKTCGLLFVCLFVGDR